MALATAAQQTSMLRSLGFLGSLGTMIANFQRGWALGTWLAVDGKYGPKTDAALKLSYNNLRAHKPTCSAHFSFSEFRCKCNGRQRGCQGVWIHRVHVQRLEAFRNSMGAFVPVSGCRCPGHNKAVGGASSSQHQFGVATDIPGRLSTAVVRSKRLFAGIGFSQSSGKVLHVDSRDVGGHNTTGGTTSNPTIWRYA